MVVTGGGVAVFIIAHNTARAYCQAAIPTIVFLAQPANLEVATLLESGQVPPVVALAVLVAVVVVLDTLLPMPLLMGVVLIKAVLEAAAVVCIMILILE
jgi:hypothetical protein